MQMNMSLIGTTLLSISLKKSTLQLSAVFPIHQNCGEICRSTHYECGRAETGRGGFWGSKDSKNMCPQC